MNDAETKIDRAQVIAQSGVIELLHGQEVRVLNKLVMDVRNGKLSDRDAAVGIATIANLRSILADMDRTVAQGITAGHSLMESPNA